LHEFSLKSVALLSSSRTRGRETNGILHAKMKIAAAITACCRCTLEKRKGKERKWTCVSPIVSITRPLSAQM